MVQYLTGGALFPRRLHLQTAVQAFKERDDRVHGFSVLGCPIAVN